MGCDHKIKTKMVCENIMHNRTLRGDKFHKPLSRGVDIWFFPLGSIPLTHCCYNIVDTPFTKTVLDFSRKISKEKNDILLDLQTSDKNTHQYIFFFKIKMYNFFHILAFPYIKKEHLPICYTQ